MSEIEFRAVSKTYPDGAQVIRGLDLKIADGEFLVLVGPSGCGKSTALRMIAGLEEASAGDILIGGARANDLAPRDRDIAMVFQNYALYPHMTVEENIGFGLKVRGASAQEIRAKVWDTAKLLELEGHLKRKPGQLSGGQRQRVAMGRALARSPRAFLMDEPLSNLDARLRAQMRADVTRLQKASRVTTVYVTHDQVEAMTMGDRVAVMNAGALMQLDAPRTLYDRPANVFVAGFIGSPPMNFFSAEVTREDGRSWLRTPHGAVALPPTAPPPGPVIAGLRPEALTLTPEAEADRAALRGRISLIEDLGATLLLHVETPDLSLVKGSADLDEEESAILARRLRVTVEAAMAGRLRQGDKVGLGFSPDKLHLFDPDSGARL